MKPAQIRRDLQHPSLLFNQPREVAPDQHADENGAGAYQSTGAFMLFGLKEAATALQLEAGVNLPVPARRSLVAPDPLSLPNLISYRKGNAHTPYTRRTRTHLCRSHIIRSTFGPSGFFFSAADWRMKPLNRRVKPRLPILTSQTSPCPSFHKLGHGCTSASSALHLA